LRNEFRSKTSRSEPGSLKLSGIPFVLILVIVSTTGGCSYNMSLQPRYNPMSRSNFFADQRSERPVVDGAIPNNQKSLNDPFNTGQQDGRELTAIPVPVTLDLLKRGRDRFDIYCSPCHGRLGDGEGMVVQRGFVHPPSYHQDRLRSAPDGHFFGVMTEGFGRMWGYANRVEVPDRWAITAYIRTLQLSQSAPLADVPQLELKQLLRTNP
jgi:hypothetical protein